MIGLLRRRTDHGDVGDGHRPGGRPDRYDRDRPIGAVGRRPGLPEMGRYPHGAHATIECVGSDVITPPRVAPGEAGTGPGSGLGRPMSVIVLNDNRNTFESVATILSHFVQGVDYAKGMALAAIIHTMGQAMVWRGDTERAELIWEQLKGAGLTMAPLIDG